jgi:hypothetical protein
MNSTGSVRSKNRQRGRGIQTAASWPAHAQSNLRAQDSGQETFPVAWAHTAAGSDSACL